MLSVLLSGFLKTFIRCLLLGISGCCLPFGRDFLFSSLLQKYFNKLRTHRDSGKIKSNESCTHNNAREVCRWWWWWWWWPTWRCVWHMLCLGWPLCLGQDVAEGLDKLPASQPAFLWLMKWGFRALGFEGKPEWAPDWLSNIYRSAWDLLLYLKFNKLDDKLLLQSISRARESNHNPNHPIFFRFSISPRPHLWFLPTILLMLFLFHFFVIGNWILLLLLLLCYFVCISVVYAACGHSLFLLLLLPLFCFVFIFISCYWRNFCAASAWASALVKHLPYSIVYKLWQLFLFASLTQL